MSNTNVAFDVSATISAIAESVSNGMSPTDAIRNSDYGIADRAVKARIRGAFKARFDSAMRDGKFADAQFNWEIHESFRSAGNGTRNVVTNSDEMRFVIHGMASALSGLISGEYAPNGIDPVDLSAEFDFDFAFTGEFDGDAPEFDSDFVARFIPRRITRNSPTNDIGELVAEFMATVPANSELKVSEIRNGIREMHPDLNVNSSWDGRINARLFPNGNGAECTIDSVVGTIRESDGRKCGMRIS